jgi:hypothetical protein
MNREDHGSCGCLDAYLDGELDRNGEARFSRHLEGCTACREAVRRTEAVRSSLREAFEQGVPDDADLRIRRRVRGERGQRAADREILDIEGVAAWLQISVAEVVALLGELPSFEIAGRIRFRRDRIRQWMAQREQRQAWDHEAASRRVEAKIIQFPGGAR